MKKHHVIGKMQSILNFRPLAQGVKNRSGKAIRQNTILRGGIAKRVSENDITALMSLGVRYIYDFRNAYEIAEIPSLSSDKFTTVHFDIIPQAAPRSYARLKTTDADTVKNVMAGRYATHFARTDAYKPVIKSILSQDSPGFLFHCTAGKDRTGIFGAILMLALDFDIDDIRTEYLTIDQPQVDDMKHAFFASVGHTGASAHLEPLFTVLPEYINAYIEGVLSSFGSFDNYLLTACGINAAAKAQLQQTYLF
jgi:protein-tyrosine phosphatase